MYIFMQVHTKPKTKIYPLYCKLKSVMASFVHFVLYFLWTEEVGRNNKNNNNRRNCKKENVAICSLNRFKLPDFNGCRIFFTVHSPRIVKGSKHFKSLLSKNLNSYFAWEFLCTVLNYSKICILGKMVG